MGHSLLRPILEEDTCVAVTIAVTIMFQLINAEKD